MNTSFEGKVIGDCSSELIIIIFFQSLIYYACTVRYNHLSMNGRRIHANSMTCLDNLNIENSNSIKLKLVLSIKKEKLKHNNCVQVQRNSLVKTLKDKDNQILLLLVHIWFAFLFISGV